MPAGWSGVDGMVGVAPTGLGIAPGGGVVTENLMLGSVLLDSVLLDSVMLDSVMLVLLGSVVLALVV